MVDENQEVEAGAEEAVEEMGEGMDEVAEGLEQVAEAAAGIADVAAGALKTGEPKTLDLILDVTLAVTIEVGRARMTVQDLLQLGQGSVIELEKLAGEPLDVFINGKRVATGEAVIVNEKFGVRLTEIISPEERINSLA
jgi:flagellar motor switch protein FliN/FliY